MSETQSLFDKTANSLNVPAFWEWERSNAETIPAKKCYCDMVSDLTSGIVLSQIVQAFTPDNNGQIHRNLVERHSKWWLPVNEHYWWYHCRLTMRQVNRAIRILKHHNYIASEPMRLLARRNWDWKWRNITNVRVKWDYLLPDLIEILGKPTLHPQDFEDFTLARSQDPYKRRRGESQPQAPAFFVGLPPQDMPLLDSLQDFHQKIQKVILDENPDYVAVSWFSIEKAQSDED